MAGQPFNLTAQLNIAGPNNLRPVVANIKRQLSGINTNLNLNISKNSSRQIKVLNKDVLALNASLQRTASISKQVSTNLSTISAAASKVSSSTQQAASAIAKTGSSANNAQQGIQSATDAMTEFGKQSGLAVKRFLAFSVAAAPIYALTRAIQNAFTEFVAFDRELVRVVQVTGASKTALAGLTKEITQLSTSLGVSSGELIKISTTLSQAGLSASQTTTALEALAKASLAPTFDDLSRTVEGSIAAMRQFNIGAGQLEQALGSINAVAANFAVEAGDIIAAIQRTGGVFAAASKGVSSGTDALNEFVAVFTSVRATTRESAETIATGLRTIFTRIQRGSTIDFLRELGVQLQDSEGKFVGPYKAIQRLSLALRGLDPRDVKFSQIVEELGGFRQIGKVIPLIQQFSTAQQALNVAQQGSASLTKDSITAQTSLANQFAKVREEFLAFVRSIGESKSFQAITKVVLGLGSSLISLGKAFKPILPYLAILGAIKGTKAAINFGVGFLGKGGASGGSTGGTTPGGGGGGGGGSGSGGGGGQAGTAAQAALTSQIQSLNSSITSQSAIVANNTTMLSSQLNATNTNSTALAALTAAINSLIGSINNKQFKSKPLPFRRGGDVPGTGSGDTVPAMLEPGEFVIRKSAVEAFGSKNLAKINKYGKGGISKIQSMGARDGDSWSVNYIPSGEEVGPVTTRANGIDAYELNKGFDWEADLAQIATEMANKYYTTRNMSNKSDLFKDLIQGEFSVGRRPVHNIPNALRKEMLDAGVAMPAKKDNTATGKTGPRPNQDQIDTLIEYGYDVSGYAKGGAVSDTVPAMLTPGEYVINKKSAQAFGYGNLKKINGYAQGGVVRNGVQFFQNAGQVRGGLGHPGSMQTVAQTNAQVQQTGKVFGLLNKISPRLAKGFSALVDRVGGAESAFLLATTTLSTQLPQLYGAIDRFTGQTNLLSSEVAAGVQGALQQGGASGFAGLQMARQAGFSRQGQAGVAGATAIAGAVSGYLEKRESKQMENMRNLLRENDTRTESILQRLEQGDVSGSKREELINELDENLSEADEALGSALDNVVETWDHFGKRIAQELAGAIMTFAGLKMLFKADGGMVYASKGQYVNFKSKGTDTVPAMLTPGEFVVNAKSTSQHRGLLEAINRSTGGITPSYFNAGGLVPMPFDEAKKQGFSTSDALKMNRMYQEGQSANIGYSGGADSLMGGYMNQLSAFYNPTHKGGYEGNDMLGSGIRIAGRGAMIIGGAAAAGAGAGIAAGMAGGSSLAAMMPTFAAGASAIGSGISTGAGMLGRGIGSAASGIGRGIGGIGRGIGRLFGRGTKPPVNPANVTPPPVPGGAPAGGGGILGGLGRMIPQTMGGKLKLAGSIAGVGGLTAFNTFMGGGPSEAQRENLQKRVEMLSRMEERGGLEADEFTDADINDILNRAGGMREGAARDAFLADSGPMVRAAEERALKDAGIDQSVLDRARRKPESARTQQETDAVNTAEAAKFNLVQDGFLKESQKNEEEKIEILKRANNKEAKLLSERAAAGEELTAIEEEIAKAYDEVNEKGKQYLARLSEQQLREERQSRVFNKSQAAAENFVDAMNTIESGLRRAASEFRGAMLQIDNAVGSLTTGAIPKMDDTMSDMFGNLKAFTPEEISSGSRNLSEAFGFQNMSTGVRVGSQGVENLNLANTLEEASLATNVLEKELPRIFRQNQGIEDSGQLAKDIKEALMASGLGEVSASAMAQQISRQASNKTIAGKSVTFDDLAKDVPGFLKSVGSLQKANELQANMYKEIATAANQFREKVEQAADASLKAAKMFGDIRRVQSEFGNALNQQLGLNTSLEQMNQPFEDSLIGATTVAGLGGTTDVDTLVTRRDDALERRDALGEEISLSGPTEAQAKEMKELTTIIKSSQGALEELASNGTRASNALSRVGQLRQVRESRQNAIVDLIANQDNPDFVMGRTGLVAQAGATAAIEQGTASREQLDVFAKNFQNILALRDPEDQESLKQAFSKEIQRVFGLGEDQANNLVENSFNPQADPKVQAAIQAAETFLKEQQKAMEDQANQQLKIAKIIDDNALKAANQFRETIVKSAEEAARLLTMQSRANVFGADNMDAGLAGTFVNSNNITDFLETGVGSVQAAQVRGALAGDDPALDLSDMQLMRLIDTGAISGTLDDGTGTQVGFQDLMDQKGPLAAMQEIREAMKNENNFGIDVDAFQDMLMNNQIRFDDEQYKTLTEQGGIRLQIQGIENLENIDLSLDDATLANLKEFIRQLKLYQAETASTFSTGGVVYASKGSIIGMKPKGTDTVPAMLTPGEFVINKAATAKNLPLLKAINGGAKGYSTGGVVYLNEGGLAENATTGLFRIAESLSYGRGLVNGWETNPNKEEELADGMLEFLGDGIQRLQKASDSTANTAAKEAFARFLSDIPFRSTTVEMANFGDSDMLADMLTDYYKTRTEYEVYLNDINNAYRALKQAIGSDGKLFDAPNSVTNTETDTPPTTSTSTKGQEAEIEEVAKARSDSEYNLLSPNYFSISTYKDWIRSLLRMKELPTGLNYAPNKNRFVLSATAMSNARDLKGEDMMVDMWHDLLREIHAKTYQAQQGIQSYKTVKKAVDEADSIDTSGIDLSNVTTPDTTGYVDETHAKNINKPFSEAIARAKMWNSSGGYAMANDDGLVKLYKSIGGSAVMDVPFMLGELRKVGEFIAANTADLGQFFGDDLKWIQQDPRRIVLPNKETRENSQRAMSARGSLGGQGVDWIGEGMSPEDQFKRAQAYFREVRGMLARKQKATAPTAVYAANGGSIFQPRGTDTVPAMLTPGEFVVNRKATQRNLGLLHNINNNPGTKYYQRGGQVSYLQNGGEASGGMSFDFSNFVNSVNIFQTSIDAFATSVGEIPSLDFGVFKSSVDVLANSSVSLNNAANIFNTAAVELGNNIGNITSAINALASIPSTITINGNIDMPTQLVVTLEGQTGEANTAATKREIVTAVAEGLSQGNPQINVSSLLDQIR